MVLDPLHMKTTPKGRLDTVIDLHTRTGHPLFCVRLVVAATSRRRHLPPPEPNQRPQHARQQPCGIPITPAAAVGAAAGRVVVNLG